MGMFDKPQYLTGGDDSFVNVGDTFWLHKAAPSGTVNTQNGPREQVKLRVSRTRDGEQSVVFTSAIAIIMQVHRIDDNDKRALPMEVRLDQVPTNKGNPAYRLELASAPPAAVTDDDATF